MARFMEKFAVCNVAHPAARRRSPPSVYAKLPRNNFIDGHVWAKLQQLGITPSEPAADATFHRRAYLDVIGRLPTPDETRAFLADTDPEKREQADRRAAGAAGVRRLLGEQVGRPAAAEPVPRRHQGDVQPRRLAARRASARTSRTTSSSASCSTAQGSTFTQRRRGHLPRPPRAGRDHHDGEPAVPRRAARLREVPPPPVRDLGPGRLLQLRRVLRPRRPQGHGLSPPISGGEEVVFAAPTGAVKHPRHRQGDAAAAAARQAARRRRGPRPARGAGRLGDVAGQPVLREGDRQPRLGRPDGPRDRRSGGRPAGDQPADATARCSTPWPTTSARTATT